MNHIQPPPYDEPTQTSYMPAYTLTASGRERVLQSPNSPLSLASTDHEWIYKTDHMHINLGPRLWDLHIPSYGLSGKVEGSVTFKGAQNHVEHVVVELVGKITAITTHRGVISGQSTHLLYSQTTQIYPSQLRSLSWDQPHAFSLSFPDPTQSDLAKSPLPPSFTTQFFNVYCDVAYTLKFDMVRKGFRRHESKIIPILYLPKSAPSVYPISVIPRPLGNPLEFPTYNTNLVRAIQLTALSPKGGSLPMNDRLVPKKAIYLTMPYPACFASGDRIPFTLNVLFTDTPALVPLLAPRISLKLVKKTLVWTNGGRNIDVRHSHIANWEPREYNDSIEGIKFMKGVIQAGTAGRECSWKVDGVAEVRYVIKATLASPKELLGACPSFEHEEVVQITTDPCGALERELLATGGVPTPALAFAPDPRLSQLNGTQRGPFL